MICDLKPENILVDTDEDHLVKLIDIGTSVKYDKKKNKHKDLEMKDSKFYIAPEVSSGKYDERCDVWSVGVIMYVMLTGKIPYEGEEYDDEVIEKLETDDRYNAVTFEHFDLENDDWAHLSDDAKALIKKMMNPKYEERAHVTDILNDPWFKNAPHQHINENTLKQVFSNLKNLNASQKLQ